MVGGFLMGVVESLVAAAVIPIGALWGSSFAIRGTNYRQAVAFLALILVLLLRPTGLFGSRRREKV
jgi:branched-subunit amino acid ABC-type transport system permease component